jgi:hypothetical protein
VASAAEVRRERLLRVGDMVLAAVENRRRVSGAAVARDELPNADNGATVPVVAGLHRRAHRITTVGSGQT